MRANELKSKIFKTAWKNFKKGSRYAKTFSKALKSAWKFWKEKVAKKVTQEFYSFEKIVRETAKALFVEFKMGGFSNVGFECWVPKSQVFNTNQIKTWLFKAKSSEVEKDSGLNEEYMMDSGY